MRQRSRSPEESASPVSEPPAVPRRRRRWPRWVLRGLLGLLVLLLLVVGGALIYVQTDAGGARVLALGLRTPWRLAQLAVSLGASDPFLSELKAYPEGLS